MCSQTAPAAGGNIGDTSYTIIEKADSAAHKTHFAMEEEEDVAANAQDDQVAHIRLESVRERERKTEGKSAEREVALFPRLSAIFWCFGWNDGCGCCLLLLLVLVLAFCTCCFSLRTQTHTRL